MADTEGDDGAKKENAVFSEESMKILANALAEKEKGMVFAMYLMVPTTRLVIMQQDGLVKKECDNDINVSFLNDWKASRSPAKEKEKAFDLERALREIGWPEAADALQEKYQSSLEITADCFPSP